MAVREGAGPLTAVEVAELPTERFAEILPADEYAAVERGVGRARAIFDGRVVWNVNSTARGGGVAEMLVSLLAYARGAGVDARWSVIAGDPAFFAVTKRIHNRLHGYEGDGGPLGEEERRAYEQTLAPSGEALVSCVSARDAVILHDPQTAGLIPVLRRAGVPVVWRCHVGVDEPGELARTAWGFLEPYVNQADAVVFSREAFAWDVVPDGRRHIIPPTIDAFSPKNIDLEDDEALGILTAAGLCTGGDADQARYPNMDGSRAPVAHRAELLEEQPLGPGERYVLQVSRWDALKDPEGVIRAFAEHVADRCDAHLLYAGPATDAVSDDPEGAAVLHRAREQWHALPPEVRARVHLAMLPMDVAGENAAMVNALQRRAAVVVQKSLAEGFGLTVAEAMWKCRPVVASRIGGIQDQIEDGRNGVLLDDPRDLAACGEAVCALLDDEPRAEEVGRAARERVTERFLGSHSLQAYLELLAGLLA